MSISTIMIPFLKLKTYNQFMIQLELPLTTMKTNYFFRISNTSCIKRKAALNRTNIKTLKSMPPFLISNILIFSLAAPKDSSKLKFWSTMIQFIPRDSLYLLQFMIKSKNKKRKPFRKLSHLLKTHLRGTWKQE